MIFIKNKYGIKFLPSQLGHKISSKFLGILIIPLILSIGIAPAFAFQLTDVDTECRKGLVLVFRIISNNFACVSETTADKWVGYGIAELAEEFVTEEISEELSYVDGVRIKPVLTGGTKPLTTTPIIGTPDKVYPEMFVPGTEELAENEMRITMLGTGMPYSTRAQAATSMLIELGGTDDFYFFDLGTGSLANFNSMKLSIAKATHVFLTHLHADHIGDIDMLFVEGVPWGRLVPLEIWGGSADAPELGAGYYLEHIEKALTWDLESRTGKVPTSGAAINVHEFDYSKTQVIYEKDGFTVTAFPAVHALGGAVSYRIDWKGISVVFSGDTKPNKFLVENSENVDILFHETFWPAELYSEKLGWPLATAKTVVHGFHTPPQSAGVIFDMTQPKLAAMFHTWVMEDTVTITFDTMRTTYDGPAVLTQDFTVFNITPDSIVVRQADVEDLVLPIVPDEFRDAELEEANYLLPQWWKDAEIKVEGVTTE